MAGIGLRIAAVPPQVADVDGVNFARALTSFDPFRQAPHFPGYPVYVLACRWAAGFGAPEVWALVLPGLVAFTIGTWLCARAVARTQDSATAERFVVLMALLPGAVLHLAWPGSDGFGLGLLLIAIGTGAWAHEAGLRPWMLFVVGTLGGLTLGARLSWWPLALGFAAWGLLRLRGAVWPALLGGLLAVTAFTLPLLLWFSPGQLSVGFTSFAHGHFNDWGGALQATSPLGQRVLTMIWALGSSLAGVDGSSWATLLMSIVSGLSLYGWLRHPRPAAAPWLAIAALYLLWVLVGQNVEKPRHLLPLVPLFALALAQGLSWLRAPTLVLAATLIAVTLPRTLTQAQPAPTAQLVHYIQHHYSPAGLQIFAGAEARVFEHLAPNYRVWRAASPEVLQREAARAHANGAKVLVTSGALGVGTRGPELSATQRFSTSRVVHAEDHDLTLFRYRQPPRSHHATH